MYIFIPKMIYVKYLMAFSIKCNVFFKALMIQDIKITNEPKTVSNHHF